MIDIEVIASHGAVEMDLSFESYCEKNHYSWFILFASQQKIKFFCSGSIYLFTRYIALHLTGLIL